MMPIARLNDASMPRRAYRLLTDRDLLLCRIGTGNHLDHITA